jgi:hypothetical protein
LLRICSAARRWPNSRAATKLRRRLGFRSPEAFDKATDVFKVMRNDLADEHVRWKMLSES